MFSGIAVPKLSADLTEISALVYYCISVVSKYTASGKNTLNGWWSLS